MGAINFDFEAIAGLAPENTHAAKISRFAALAGAEPRNGLSQGQDVSRLASLAGANPRFSPPAELQEPPYPANDANLLIFGAGEARAAGKPASALNPPPGPQAAAEPENRILDESDWLREWRAGIARIDHDRPPNGFPAKDWQNLHRDAGPFLDAWGTNALALGWSTLDVFGVHRIAPAANYSAMGLVPLLHGAVVVALTADSAVIQKSTGNRLTFRRQPPHDEAIPVWDFVLREVEDAGKNKNIRSSQA